MLQNPRRPSVPLSFRATRVPIALAGLGLALVLTGCTDVVEPAPGPLTLVIGDSAAPRLVWLRPVGTAIPDSITVAVTDTADAPVPGIELEWTATGGGMVQPLTSITDSAGTARARWTLGDQVGEQWLVVTAPTGDSASANAIATPPPPDDWSAVLDVVLTVAPAELDAAPPDTLTATLAITNQWTGAMRLKTRDTCLAITTIYDAEGTAVEIFSWGCWMMQRYWFVEPGETIRTTWTIDDLALEPGEYTVRADPHLNEINGDPFELADPEATLTVR